jgi:hypothetical protein
MPEDQGKKAFSPVDIFSRFPVSFALTGETELFMQ